MPRSIRRGNQIPNARITSTTIDNIIRLDIPLSMAQRQDCFECQICRERFCSSGKCGRTLVRLTCCTSPICAKCVFKQATRCTCKESCDQVVTWCAFCRSLSPLTTLDVFLGTLRKRNCEYCPSGESDEEMDEEYVPGNDGDDEDDDEDDGGDDTD